MSYIGKEVNSMKTDHREKAVIRPEPMKTPEHIKDLRKYYSKRKKLTEKIAKAKTEAMREKWTKARDELDRKIIDSGHYEVRGAI